MTFLNCYVPLKRKWDRLSVDNAVEKILYGSYPEMKETNDPVKTAFVNLLWKCFALEPKKRPTAMQIVENLDSLLNETYSRM